MSITKCVNNPFKNLQAKTTFYLGQENAFLGIESKNDLAAVFEQRERGFLLRTNDEKSDFCKQMTKK